MIERDRPATPGGSPPGAPRGRLVLVTGGARSGKSTFAEAYARRSSKQVVYVATARVLDGEMAERVRAHRAARPAGWLTVEETLNLPSVIRRFDSPEHLLLVDCLTMLATNLLLEGMPTDPGTEVAARVHGRLTEAAQAARAARCDVVAVTNEVGMGIVPDNALSRTYRDVAGRANQEWAARADEVYVLFAGVPLKLK